MKSSFRGHGWSQTYRIYWMSSIASRPILGLYSLSGKTSYRKISWSLEAARFGFKLFQLLWNLAGTSAALLPRCLSNFRAIRPLQHPISRLRDFTSFDGKTSYRLVNRGPGKCPDEGETQSNKSRYVIQTVNLKQYSDVIRATWRPESSATRLFLNCLFIITTNKHEMSSLLAFCGPTHQWPLRMMF